MKRMVLSLGVFLTASIPFVGFASPVQQKPPLTKTELHQTLKSVEQMLDTVLKLPKKPTSLKAITGTGPATRASAIDGLYRIHLRTKPVHTFLPNKTPFDFKRIKKLADGTTQKHLDELLWWGYVAPVGPIAAGPRDAFTLEQWGDAIGYFLSRVAELTHTPSSKFSPYLMR